ncbi:MAG: tRNA (adenosine(37)-N6)-dimethylallyltransferase MiaA [Ignavibacteria bacterium]|nr:tRNA (adenosine(37)-N6)-dimethylallyltransferase MiaA [Ignavibacteria bacterium]
MASKRKVLAIVGPTASGKTKLAIETAKILNGEIISADSRQNYKHIPIATAVPSVEERQGIPHYFLQELNLTENFTAGEFGKAGRKIIDSIFEKGMLPLICGGSGLYIRSLIDGFFEEETRDENVRKNLYHQLKEKGKDFIYNELKEIDRIAASTMLPENTRRVIRALEVYFTSGKKISELQQQKIEISFRTVQVGLYLERKFLYDRINKRVDEMIENGLVDEVERLKSHGYDWRKYNSLNTVGIKEVFGYLEGDLEYKDMVELIKQNTRRYAKRQMTWFKADTRILWLEVKEEKSLAELAKETAYLFRNN